MKKIALSISIFFILLGSILEARLPELRIQDGQKLKPLQLEELEIHIIQRGHLARTEWILTYKNNESRDLRGDFIFPIPDQATVSDVGLYFGDRLRHGVVVEREQGRRAYEEIVHRRVDPALAEWSSMNLFRLDVYPIPAKGEKKIFVSYDQRLEISPEQFLYSLQLDHKEKLRNLEVKVDSDESCTANSKGAAISRNGNAWYSKVTNQVPPKEISLICNRGATQEALAEEDPEDGSFFVSIPLDVTVPKKEVQRTPALLIFWDISGSMEGASKDVKNLLQALIANNPDARITIVPFHFSVLDPIQVMNQVSSIENTMIPQLAAGATDLFNLFQSAEILLKQQPVGSRAVLITDGNDSFHNGAEILEAFKKVNQLPWLVVAANAASNNGLLQQLAESSGGSFVSDSALMEGISALGNRIMSLVPQFEIWSGTQLPEDRIVHAIPLNANRELLYLLGKVTRVSGVDDITVQIKQGPNTSFLQNSYRYRLISDSPGLVRRDWARSRLQAMLSSSLTTDQQWIDFGKKFHIVTPKTSLIVLETWQDYQRYGIEMPPDVRAEYDRLFTPQKPQIQNTTAGTGKRLGNASIYGIVFDDQRMPLPGVSVTLSSTTISNLVATTGRTGGFRFANLSPGDYTVDFSLEGFNEIRQEGLRVASGSQLQLNIEMKIFLAEEMIVVTGESPVVDVKQSASQSYYDFDDFEELPADARDPWRIIDQTVGVDGDQFNVAASTIRERNAKTIWNDDGVDARSCADFSDQLKVSNGSKFERRKFYTDLRQKCFSVKRFYLESAEIFNEEDQEFSLRVLMDAVEFINSESGAYRVLAKKLQVWQRPDLAEKVLLKALQNSPNEPHNRLELGHLYAQLGKIVEARKQLESAVNSPEASQYAGLQQIVRSELARLENVAGGKSIYVDNDSASGLTVLLSWDINNTDIDLHVVEPGGEEVSYNHNSSAAGGRLLADNIAGYGPEIYTIAKPRSGIYKIRINYYGNDRTATTESATATVTIYQKDGKGGFLRQEFTIVFTGQSEDFDVASVRFS